MAIIKIINEEGGSDARYDVSKMTPEERQGFDDEGRPLGANNPDQYTWTPGLPGARGGTGPGGGGGGGGGGGRFDYSYDPFLQEFNVESKRDEQAARANLKEKQRRRLIMLGSRDVASKILGADDPTLASISSDPFGTSQFSRVLKQYNDMLRGVEEDTSMSNTFFGTGRATGYQSAAYGRQQTEADLVRSAESDLQGYQDAMDAFMRDMAARRRQMEADAWMRQMWGNILSGGPSRPSGPSGPPAGADPYGTAALDQLLNQNFDPDAYKAALDAYFSGQRPTHAGGGVRSQ